MAKKNITFRIEEKSIEKLNELRGDLSQNAFLELLLANYNGETTSTSTSTSNEQVQVQLQAQSEILAKLQVQVQLLVQAKEKPTSTSTSTSKKEPIIKDKKETVPTFDASAALDAILNEEPDPFDERYFHVIKKVKSEGSPEYGDSVHKSNGRLSWFLEKGDSQCFDENQVMIPFTYRKAYGDIRRPNADEIKKIEEAYGKPVTIEK